MQNPGLALEIAQKIISAGCAQARHDKLAVSLVVVDQGGRVVASARMDGAPYATHEIAQRKAATSANFGVPLPALANSATSDPLIAMVFQSTPELCVTPGGMPVIMGGTCVGGVGVSGASYDQDQAIADAAVKAL